MSIDHLHGHLGVASTLALTRQLFYWVTAVRDVREYVLCCGCHRCKSSSSQQTCLSSGTRCRAVGVSKSLFASYRYHLFGRQLIYLTRCRQGIKVSFPFSMPSKEAEGIACPVAARRNIWYPPRCTKRWRSRIQLRYYGKTPLSAATSCCTIQSDETTSRPRCGKASRRVDATHVCGTVCRLAQKME